VTTKNNFTTNNFEELSILVSLYGLSFMLKNGETKEKKFFEYSFNPQNPVGVEKELIKIIEERDILKNNFEKLHIIHHNKLNTLIPKAIFDKDLIKDYLNFNIKLLPTDFADFDEINSLKSVNAFVPFVNINNILLDYNKQINFHHSASIFLKKIQKIRKQKTKLNLHDIYVNVYTHDFQLAIFKDEKLELYNHFPYENIDEFLYYLFFAFESLQLDKNKTNFNVSGIDNQHEIIKNLKDFSPKIHIITSDYKSQINNFMLS